MILTYKIRHGRDFTKELAQAKKVAEHATGHRTISSKDVKHIGLKSIISNQILRKYARNKTIKRINSVNLAIPNQGMNVKDDTIFIPSLKLQIPIMFPKTFKKINQIELDKEYAYISVTVDEPKSYKPKQIIGVDRNATKHVLVASNITTGKVLKLGKECQHIHNKYKNIRKKLQKQGKFRLLKKIKNRESRIVKNINHQISNKLITDAQRAKAIIVLEELKNIRKTARTRKKQRHSLNSWSFYQLQQMIEYKAEKYGVPVAYVAPQYTSQRCSHCGLIDRNSRKEKEYHCTNSGMVENADTNAGFNIASLYQQGISRFNKESDLLKGNTDIPKEAML